MRWATRRPLRQAGQVYELESSSPALALNPGASAMHRRQALHLQGDEKELVAISKDAAGVQLKTIQDADK